MKITSKVWASLSVEYRLILLEGLVARNRKAA